MKHAAFNEAGSAPVMADAGPPSRGLAGSDVLGHRTKPTRAKVRTTPPKAEVREERITMEIVVDAYNEDERAMGWCCYHEEKSNVPFLARCIEERTVSPLEVGDEFEVVGMAPGRGCEPPTCLRQEADGRPRSSGQGP